MVRRRARAGVVPLRGLSEPIVLAPAPTGPPMGASVGAQTVKVPQIQFFDDKVAGQFQFLDKVMVAPVLCNDSCRCSLVCSTLTSC